MNLIIITGAPGSGKSTVAEALHKTFPPLSFLLKFDAQRRFLKDRHEYREQSASLTHAVCKSIAETCLKQGKDVIFEGAVINSSVLDAFVSLGKEYKARTFEFILWADKEIILHRNANREAPADGLPDTRRVEPAKAEMFWEKIDALKDERPNAHIIDVKENNLEQVLSIIQSILRQ